MKRKIHKFLTMSFIFISVFVNCLMLIVGICSIVAGIVSLLVAVTYGIVEVTKTTLLVITGIIECAVSFYIIYDSLKTE